MSIATSSESLPSADDALRHPCMAAETHRVLTEHYNGMTCILTQDDDSVEWVRIIKSFPPISQLPEVDFLRNHGLIPLDLSQAEHLNIIPVALFGKLFYDNIWTIYPTEDTLRTFIAQEEARLIKREECIVNGLDDPGRLLYAESYGRMPKASYFEFHFSQIFRRPAVSRWNDLISVTTYKSHPTLRNAHLPTLPPALLIASVNIVVLTQTKTLPNFTYELISERDRVLGLCKLGTYLQNLWVATPLTFRSLSRPSSLQVTTPTLPGGHSLDAYLSALSNALPPSAPASKPSHLPSGKSNEQAMNNNSKALPSLPIFETTPSAHPSDYSNVIESALPDRDKESSKNSAGKGRQLE